ERDAILEQLARDAASEALLQQVSQRLSAARDAHERSMLTLLRYRLAASSALVLAWPGGLERLAAPEVATRQAAAQELARRAGAGETRLLTELLTDADPLVREVSLTSLREVGGPDAVAALGRLLNDP